MDCPRCRERNPEDARFCESCGAPFAPLCSTCGREIRAGTRFCAGCGQPIEAGAGPAQVTEKERPLRDGSPLAYTPEHLADKILQSRSALAGERKQVTVLFADVKGSLELALLLGDEATRLLELRGVRPRVQPEGSRCTNPQLRSILMLFIMRS